tara:strand:- start:11859 stop:12497 length:639 start_codon:yes stop_codon:yes gene_type:complete
MDQTQRDVQRHDVQTICKICNHNGILIPPFNKHEVAIEAWIQETIEGRATTPMPWQILLDGQGTRTLNLEVATKLYMSGLIPSYVTFAGSFLEHMWFKGENITEAFMDFMDDVTVSYPLTITGSNEINEVLNAPLILSKVDFRFNEGARIHLVKNESLKVPSNVYKGMIESTHEEPIFFGRDQSLCIFEGHVRYTEDVFDDCDSEFLKGALN